VNSLELYKDLANNNLPQYMYYTPNMNNDGHDTDVNYAGYYLGNLLDSVLSQFPAKTLVVITWDEDNYLDGNHIYLAMLGSMIQPGTTDGNSYNHYSILRTVEDNWSLGNLGRNDANANPFKF